MAGPNLPVNVDNTYPDTGDASVGAHQRHHDAIHAIVNEFDTTIANATAGQSLRHDGTVFKPGGFVISGARTASDPVLSDAQALALYGEGAFFTVDPA